MAAKTVLNYLPRESVIHKLTGTTKLAFFLFFTFGCVIPIKRNRLQKRLDF